jgi:hypothetical protein
MSRDRISRLRAFEGRQVGVALADGSRIDDCQLVSAGRVGTRTLWVFANGVDLFLPHSQVRAVWESVPRHRAA